MRRHVVAAILTISLSSPVSADWKDPNVEGAKEHPIVRFYPDARVDEYDQKAFDSVEVVTGLKGEGDEQEATTEEIEGRITKFTYEHKPGTSALEILRQYENALAKVGFLKLVSGRRAKLPTHALINGDTFGAFRLDRDGKPAVYVNVGASDQGSWVESHVVIAEPGAMEQKLNADADSFFDQLGSSGRVAVYGINFDTARADIRADSESVLAEIERLLKTHDDLKLRVEGHTDNIGQPAANQKLSQLRAAAVVSWLIKHGIKQGRLTAVGLGDKAPLADNQTEEGRAKNRRVELVK